MSATVTNLNADLPDYVNYNKIEEGIYLGNLTTALSIEVLKQLHISHILTIDSKPLPENILSLQGMQFYYIQVDDMSHEDLLSRFPDIYDFISDGQQKGTVLVHCYFGVSRSACAVISYLMKKYSKSVDEIYQLVKSKRRFIGPNTGFMAQLILYERLNYSLKEEKFSYKLYKLELAAKRIRKHLPLDSLKDVFIPSSEDAAYGKCKVCRKGLFGKSSVVHHLPKETPTWQDAKWDKIMSASELCYQGIYILPQEWMKDALNKLEGKLYCPKCDHKIGFFNWIKGCQCACSACFSPGFLVTSSKIDFIK